MNIRFIAKYYSVVTEDWIEIKFDADSIEEACKEAFKRTPDKCDYNFDLYVDVRPITECFVEDRFGHKIRI